MIYCFDTSSLYIPSKFYCWFLIFCYSDGTNLKEVSLDTLGGTIGTAQIADDAVNNDKIADDAVHLDHTLYQIYDR